MTEQQPVWSPELDLTSGCKILKSADEVVVERFTSSHWKIITFVVSINPKLCLLDSLQSGNVEFYFPFKNAGRCRLNQINQSAAGNSIMNDCLWSVYLDQCNNSKKKLTKQDVLYDVCSVIIALIQLIMFKLWLSFDLRERNVKFT